MLNEHQINMIPERICERLAGINTEYLEIIGNLIKEVGELRPTDVHRLQRMYDTGADLHRISLMLAEVSDKNVQDIYDAFDIVARDNYEYSRPFFEAQAMQFIPYEENENLQRYVKSVAKQTAGDYINLTQHTAFAVFDPGGKSIAPLFAKNKDKVATSLSDTYTKIMDYAVTKVQLGETDYQSAMREVQKAMVNSGIKTVDYATGYKRRLDTAVRQNVLWGLKECNQNTADMVGEEFGADGYEISYHSNPRPSHADMGGRQYAKGEARTVKGVYYPSFEKEAEPLLNEYGCLHFKFSILLGISRPTYSKEQLEQMKAEDKQTFEFEGKEYTRYEASQLQRKIETAVRHEKDLANMAKASGDDDLRREAQYKINLLTSKYAQLSKASGLPTKMERMQVGGFRRVKTKNELTKSTNGGIIKEQSKKNITAITDKAIESVSKVAIPGFSDEQNLFIQGQHKELLKYARDNNDNNEVAFVFRKDLSDRAEFLGSDDEIEFGSGLLGKGDGLFVMHNHPRNSSYSDRDIRFFISNEDIKSFSIVKNNGTIEVIIKNSNFSIEKMKVVYGRAFKTFVINGTEEEIDRAINYMLKKNGGIIKWIK